MGISTGRSGSGPRSDINITPLVDVALVLLIIFLVVMPIRLLHIPIEVPPEIPHVSTATPIVLVGKLDGTVELDDGRGATRTVNRVDLARTLRPMVDTMPSERVVFVDFEDELAYADVISLMDTVKGMGRDASGHEANPVVVALKTAGR